VADIVVGVLCLAAYAALGKVNVIFPPRGSSVPVHDNAGYAILGLVGVMCVAIGVLYLVPLPPLDGARIMWALAPPTPGWQKARYNLEEQNYGLGALVLLSLPLFSGEGLIVRIAYAVAQPLIDAVTQALGS
jgi:membrane-associated protease RseP (regulator of RpoE activity)